MRQSSTVMQAHIAALEPQMKVLQEDFVKQMATATPQISPKSTAPAKSGTAPPKK